MKLTLSWRCDGCGKTKPQTITYDWGIGLGDVWHPRWLHGTDIGGKAQLLCGPCHKIAMDEFWKKNPNAPPAMA